MTLHAPAYTDLLGDLCQHIANTGIAQYNPNGVYTSTSKPAIYRGVIPDESTGVGIGIAVYGDDRWRDDTTADVLVQIRVRGTKSPDVANQVADDIFRLLHDQQHYLLNNNTSVLLSRRHLRAPEERDTSSRYHRIDSYTLTTNPS